MNSDYTSSLISHPDIMLLGLRLCIAFSSDQTTWLQVYHCILLALLEERQLRRSHSLCGHLVRFSSIVSFTLSSYANSSQCIWYSFQSLQPSIHLPHCTSTSVPLISLYLSLYSLSLRLLSSYYCCLLAFTSVNNHVCYRFDLY